MECIFDLCNFSNIKFESDLSISGGKVIGTQVKNMCSKMNMSLDVKFIDDEFENVVLDVVGGTIEIVWWLLNAVSRRIKEQILEERFNIE